MKKNKTLLFGLASLLTLYLLPRSFSLVTKGATNATVNITGGTIEVTYKLEAKNDIYSFSYSATEGTFSKTSLGKTIDFSGTNTSLVTASFYSKMNNEYNIKKYVNGVYSSTVTASAKTTGQEGMYTLSCSVTDDVGTINVTQDKRAIYLSAGVWNAASAWFWVDTWGTGSNIHHKMHNVSDDKYRVFVDPATTGYHFYRIDPSHSDMDYNGVWNQTSSYENPSNVALYVDGWDNYNWGNNPGIA